MIQNIKIVIYLNLIAMCIGVQKNVLFKNFLFCEYNNIMLQSFKIYLYKLLTKYVHCSQKLYHLIIIKNT